MSEPQPRAQTPVNPKPVFIIESEVKFTRDLSNFWYKPNASREETIAGLRFQPMGSFIIRNSNSFPGAYGLAIKVDESTTTEDSVRHFLIEPTKYGVRLRGSAVEPVFGKLRLRPPKTVTLRKILYGSLSLSSSLIIMTVSYINCNSYPINQRVSSNSFSACQLYFSYIISMYTNNLTIIHHLFPGSLSALVYAHSVEPLALPTTLALPSADTVLPTSQAQSTTAHLLAQGAACQLLFLGMIGVECVTGDDAVARGVGAVSGVTPPTVVSLRLSKQGLTLTDVFRQRYAYASHSYYFRILTQ